MPYGPYASMDSTVRIICKPILHIRMYGLHGSTSNSNQSKPNATPRSAVWTALAQNLPKTLCECYADVMRSSDHQQPEMHTPNPRPRVEELSNYKRKSIIQCYFQSGRAPRCWKLHEKNNHPMLFEWSGDKNQCNSNANTWNNHGNRWTSIENQ